MSTPAPADHAPPVARPRRDVRVPLICLNVALVVLLAVLSLPGPAAAQNSSQPVIGRARGEYTMVAGRSNAGGSSVIYVLDTTNQEVVALRWDQSRTSLTSLGYRNFAADTRTTPGR
ncbi:MAG: hypothetical protein SFY69_01365 [Planctomycetota bacterium]|nr:hypothetical protein [Planctomycetota bacterium]